MLSFKSSNQVVVVEAVKEVGVGGEANWGVGEFNNSREARVKFYHS